jgi:signal transduction histidine kinase
VKIDTFSEPALRRIIRSLFPVPDDAVGERRQKFIVGLRFRAIVSLAFAFLFLILGRTGAGPKPPLKVLLTLLGVLSGVNILHWVFGSRRGFPLRDFYLHWAIDLLLISGILFCLGGISVPYGFLSYLMLVVTSATFLSKRGSFVVAIGATIATLGMSWCEAAGVINPPAVWAVPMTPGARLIAVSVAILFYFVFAYLAGTLADQLKEANTHLLHARNEIELQNALLEQKVAERTEQLEKRKAEIEEFVHIVTHDLKNVSIGATETARQLLEREASGLKDRAKRYAEHLLEDTRRMNEMLMHLLAIFRIDHEAVEGRRVDIGDVAASILKGQTARLEAKGIKASVSALPEILIDETQLKHVLANLIDNAIKYVGDKAEPAIKIRCDSRPEEWVISVEDNGIGVTNGQNERIFQLYHRGPQQAVRGVLQAGEGVGLAISKRIVERWGGRIWVESEPSIGSCFCFSVPKK